MMLCFWVASSHMMLPTCMHSPSRIRLCSHNGLKPEPRDGILEQQGLGEPGAVVPTPRREDKPIKPKTALQKAQQATKPHQQFSR